MAVLPEGFALPPLPYLVGLLAGLGAVGWVLVRRRPPVTEGTVIGFIPWMVVGAALHVLHVLRVLPSPLRPLTGTPSVYLAVGLAAGATWLVASTVRDDAAGTSALLGGAGTAALVPTVGATLTVGLARGTLRPIPAVGIVVLTAALGAGTWHLLRRLRPGVAVTGRLGGLAVGSHALDGVSTAVGIDLLGFGERTPLSRLIIETAGTLPVADLVGRGWLFVLVKLAVAGTVVVVLAESVREKPPEGRLLLGVVAAVGLGPGAHNVLLFLVSV
jgi:uncharacterized membrane protein